MAQSESVIPLHVRHKKGQQQPERKITFANEGFVSTWSRRTLIVPVPFGSTQINACTGWRGLVRQVNSPSSGSPSDGLDEVSASESSVPTLKNTNNRDQDDSDWVVDEIVVAGETENSHHKSEHGTNTGTRPSDTSSIHHFSIVEEDLYRGGVYSWLRWRAWPAVYTFFEPRFEDRDREMEFQKQAWYQSKSLAFYASLCEYCFLFRVNRSSRLFRSRS